MMKEEPKVLEKGESTYRNGAGGAMCGGVMSETEFFKDVEANMMAYYMKDENFEVYKKLRKGNKDAARKWFNKYAISFI